MSELSENELEILRHMVGAKSHIPKRNWGYRNYFAASDCQKNDLKNLLSDGLITEGKKRGDLTFYFCTKLGCEAIGPSKAATQRALYEQ